MSLTHRLRALLALPLLGCSVDVSAAFGELAENECSEDADCKTGDCRFGVCVASEGELDTVLLEVTPPTTAPLVGGTQFLQVARGFSKNRNDLAVNVHRPAFVRGYVLPYDFSGLSETDPLRACGASTLPVKVTLIPREQILGLSTTSHIATARELVVTERAIAEHPCGEKLAALAPSLFDFSLNVPAGDYDVYVEAGDAASPECRGAFVPQLLRSITVEAGDVCLPLSAGKPQVLSLDILWPPDATQTLDKWFVDMVHPVTGHVLSKVLQLNDTDRVTVDGVGKYHIELPYSLVTGGDYSGAGQELVRLKPPEASVSPTIQLERSVLDATTGEAVIGNLEPFPPPVLLESWVWERAAYLDDNREVAVPATVTLTATSLRGIAPGIFASFSTTAEVEDNGRLAALVLPGEYRARIVPHVGSGRAATEATLTVSCGATDPVDPTQCDTTLTESRLQAGKTLLVPEAADISGRAISPLGADMLQGAVVQALPAQFRAKQCEPVADAGADAGMPCSTAPLGVLELALGEDRFVPRTVTAPVGSKGVFKLEDADCGECKPGVGAAFDVFVQPRDGSGLAWLVQTGFTVEDDTDLGSLELPMPIVQRGIVQVPRVGRTPAPISGALIRAYIFRDDQGAYLSDVENVPSCASRTTGTLSPTERCIRSVLQVAETRSADDGTFELLMPSHLR